MRLVKCPRCELNYMNETDEMCTVCRREVRGEAEVFEIVEMCSECGENPVVPGQELCAECLKERAARTDETADDGAEVTSAASIGIDSVSSMDEIELGIGDDMEGEDFSEDADGEFDEDEDDEEEDR